MSFAVSSSLSAAAGSAFLSGSALRQSSSAPRRAGPGRAAPAAPSAFLGGLFGGGAKQPDGVPMICRDCGYIYRGNDFDSLPRDYKCPPCGSGKSAFRPEKKMDLKKDGFNTPGIRAAKKDSKAAFEAKRAAARAKAAADAKKK